MSAVIDTAAQLRKIARRTFGRKNGPAVRLMSPGDLGQFLKPFVFLDFFDMKGPPFVGQLHPHSGIATLSLLIDGRMDLIDPDGNTVVLPRGGVEWMQAGRGMWHGGSVGDEGHLRAQELVAFEHAEQSVEFEALTDTQFLLGSAVPHGHHPLSLGHYSVHTSPAALRAGEAHIQAVGRRLVSEGRLQPWQL